MFCRFPGYLYPKQCPKVKVSISFTLKTISSSTSKSWPPDQPRGPTSTVTTSRPSSSDLETRVSHLEEEITKARNCRETILSIYRSQFYFSLSQILSPGVWRHRHYPMEINFIETGFRHHQNSYPT